MSRFIEEDLMYCPDCKEEYRAEIVQCADCGSQLRSGKEMLAAEERKKQKTAGKNIEPDPDEELVDVRKGPIRELKQTKALLASHGVGSLIVSDQSCGKGCCGPDVLLKIRPTDLPEVMDIFSREYQNQTALHDHDTSLCGSVYNTQAGETTCPACGHSFSTQSTICPDCGLCFA